jgi:hypothetical protein
VLSSFDDHFQPIFTVIRPAIMVAISADSAGVNVALLTAHSVVKL